MGQYPYGTSGICPNTETYNEAVAASEAEKREPPDYPANKMLVFTDHENSVVASCQLTVNECFYYKHNGEHRIFLKDFAGYDESNPIPLDEFDQFLKGVAADLYLHDVDSPGFQGGRGGYDTPFYNGGSKENPIGYWSADQSVCIETIGCYGRSEINYVAQGMWSAAAGESLITAQAIATAWKIKEYGKLPTKGVYFWVEYGYRSYKEQANEWDKFSPQ